MIWCNDEPCLHFVLVLCRTGSLTRRYCTADGIWSPNDSDRVSLVLLHVSRCVAWPNQPGATDWCSLWMVPRLRRYYYLVDCEVWHWKRQGGYSTLKRHSFVRPRFHGFQYRGRADILNVNRNWTQYCEYLTIICRRLSEYCRIIPETKSRYSIIAQVIIRATEFSFILLVFL